MNLKQKLYDLKNQKANAVTAAKTLIGEDKLDSEEYRTQKALIDSLNTQIGEVEALIGEEEKGFAPGQQKDLHGLTPGALEKTYSTGTLKGLKESSVKSFAADIRKSLTEGTAADGGYTVPEDIVNRVYSLIEAQDNVLPYITNTPVTTNSGKRSYKTRKQLSGFATVAEAAAIPAQEQPSFAQVSYTIAKRAGYLPVSNELLEDSDENIATLVINWLADEGRVTINKKAFATATAGTPTSISGLDDILTILTTTLGSALRAVSTVHTNDSGLLRLITMKDNNGRPLLQPDPTAPARMMLCVGPTSVPIKVWDNATLGNVSGKIPFIIGSLQEGVERFDRRSVTITRLTEATVGSINLAEQDMTAFKATMRDDYQLRDSGAFVYALMSETSPALKSIAITKAPTKTAYTAGESFAKAGMTVTATYTDNSTKAVTNNCTVIGGDSLTAGTTSVTVVYTEGGVIAGATQVITVTAS